jgi:hypothetical protein
MSVKKTSIDFHWTSDGDIRLGGGGDIARANIDEGRITKQLMLKRLQSRKGDWSLSSEVGADLVDFVGLPNTRETGQLIQAAVIQSLTEDGTVMPGSLDVDVFPASKHRIVVAITARIPFSSEVAYLQLDYDLRSNSIIPRII